MFCSKKIYDFGDQKSCNKLTQVFTNESYQVLEHSYYFYSNTKVTVGEYIDLSISV